jgi:hypothetical protein
MRSSRKRWMTAKQLDAWFAKLDRFADVPFMEEGRDQPPMPPDTGNPWDSMSKTSLTKSDRVRRTQTRSGSGRSSKCKSPG